MDKRHTACLPAQNTETIAPCDLKYNTFLHLYDNDIDTLNKTNEGFHTATAPNFK